jgi:hypothetical protein
LISKLTNGSDRKATPHHIAAEMRDPQNVEVARMVGRQHGELGGGKAPKMEGSELYLKPAGESVEPGRPVSLS